MWLQKAESRAEEAVEKIRVQQEALRMAASRIAEADREAAEARRSAEEVRRPSATSPLWPPKPILPGALNFQAARERNEVLRKLREAADGRDAAASSAAELKAAKEKIVATTLEAQKVCGMEGVSREDI